MSSDVSPNLQQNRSRKKRFSKRQIRWVSWFIVAAFLLPMIAAYVMYTTGIGLPKQTVNKGTLLEPATSILTLDISSTDGNSIDLTTEKKWRWLIVGSNDCQQECLDTLYTSRQVHIRLGEKATRLERLYLNTASEYDTEFSEQLTVEHPRLVMAHVDAEDWQKTLETTNAADLDLNGTSVYVVDQEGFAMMTYDSSNQGTDLLSDIKRLLKYSYQE
ncbi:hypothetical protein [Pseudomaricurvus sp.]|uniref:hypothetical protein n=1 Tax=Pseudomaricurvus sp. TaxID=2004510 RepID=UPI003F6AC22A